MIQHCIQCDSRFPLEQVIYTCPGCGAVLEIEIDPRQLAEFAKTAPAARMAEQGVWRYAALLPVSPAKRISLGEGNTGLHRCERLGRELGVGALYVKNEGENPTGSFKDRGMTVGVTHAVELGAGAVACASTGNTAASLAAYA